MFMEYLLPTYGNCTCLGGKREITETNHAGREFSRLAKVRNGVSIHQMFLRDSSGSEAKIIICWYSRLLNY